jgi:N-acetylmuramoyl-L-alanine amidase
MKTTVNKVLVPVVIASSLLVSKPASAYTVKAGDTMSEIASRHDMTLSKLAEMNPQVRNLDLIYVGQEINVGQKIAAEKFRNVENDEKDLLARLVHAEAKGESFNGKVAVAVTVLNRVDSPEFPNTIKDVIYQKGQFTPVSNGMINNPADEEAKQAVEVAFKNRTHDALYFYNPKTAKSSWLDSRPTVTVIGNHVFKK